MQNNIIIQQLKLEILGNDFSKEMTIEEVVTQCYELGEGWRLPSKLEFLTIFNDLHLNLLGSFKNSYYWTGEPIIDGKAVCFNFSKCKFYSMNLKSVTKYPNPYTGVNFDPSYYYKYIYPIINRSSTLTCYGRAVRTII